MAAEDKPTNPKDAVGSMKLPLHLWPSTATAMGCIGMLNGMLRYGRSNFRALGVRASIYADACKRHIDAWFEGEEVDPDDGVPHLAAALCCLAIIVDARAAGKLNDDRMVEGGYRKLVTELTPHVARLKALHAAKNPRHYTIKDNTKEDKCEGHECRERALIAEHIFGEALAQWEASGGTGPGASIVEGSTGPGPERTDSSVQAASTAAPVGSDSRQTMPVDPDAPSAPRGIGLSGKITDDRTCAMGDALSAEDPQCLENGIVNSAAESCASGRPLNVADEDRKEGVCVVGAQSRNSWRFQKRSGC